MKNEFAVIELNNINSVYYLVFDGDTATLYYGACKETQVEEREVFTSSEQANALAEAWCKKHGLQ